MRKTVHHPEPLKQSGERVTKHERGYTYVVLVENVLLPNGQHLTTKTLFLKAGTKLSYQRHFHRAETHLVLEGRVRFTISDTYQLLQKGQQVSVACEEWHAIEAIEDVIISEVMTGLYYEEDIERQPYPEGTVEGVLVKS